MSRYQHLIDAMKEDEYLTMTIAKSELHAILIDLEFAIEARTQAQQAVEPVGVVCGKDMDYHRSQLTVSLTRFVKPGTKLYTHAPATPQAEPVAMSEVLRRIKYEAVSLADAQVIALEALADTTPPPVQPMSDEQRELLARDDCGITDWTDPVNHGATASMRAAFRRGTKAAEAYHDITQPQPKQDGGAA
jgi:hypothetical protein